MIDDDDIQEYVRPWKGLTDKEKQEWIDAMPYPPQPRHFMVLVNAIESELKERNA
jgi:hypothetical protein